MDWKVGLVNRNVPFWRGYKTSQQTISFNTNTAVSTFVERESGGGTWAYPTGASPNTYWQVPRTGLYLVAYEASANSTLPGAGQTLQIMMNIDKESAHGSNDEHYARTTKMLVSSANANPRVTGSTLLRLTTSNKLYLVMWHNIGGTVVIPHATVVSARIDVTLQYVGE